MPDTAASWHLDKKVPVGIILAIFCQTMAGAYWVSHQEARITEAIATNAAQDSRIHDIELSTQASRETAATLTERLNGISDQLSQLRQDQRETNDLLRQVITGKAKQ